MSYRVTLWLILIPIINGVNCFEKDITVSIDPRREECFYETVKIGQIIDIEYQVIDGGQGEIDINFHLAAPSGRIIVADIKKPDDSHRHEATEDGDYRFCFDNTFSRYNSKTIFFELIIETEEDDNEDPFSDLDNFGYDPEGLYDMKIQDILDAINRVRSHLGKVRHIQDTLRAFEARDRNIAESNFVRVNYWSMIQIVGMVFVGLIQVLMLRSLFDDKSRVHRLWKSSFDSQ